MCWLTSDKGQSTVEAAFAIPIVFTLILLLVQPGIVLYDRMVMRHAAAEGCRLLATQSPGSGFSLERCEELVLRQLSAIPPHDLFHIHSGACSWEIELSGGESTGEAVVSIKNKIRLLPLFDAAGSLVGVADSEGCLPIEVEERAQTQPLWVQEGTQGLDPHEWVHARKGD